MNKYPIYCRISKTNGSIGGTNDSIIGTDDSIVGMNDSIAGFIVAVETHGRASLQCGNGRASLQYDTNNPTNDNPLECDNVNFFQL